ncbi:MAG: fibronectin type III domain-containing protein, partial [Candidatus Peregrinibacteria bacterium]|nr:fibronectin type III domain-containing protein [Candidatus Peregrinibacteria bacterium]
MQSLKKFLGLSLLFLLLAVSFGTLPTNSLLAQVTLELTDRTLPETPDDFGYFGYSVDIDTATNTAVIGGYNYLGRGEAWIFEKIDGAWAEVTMLSNGTYSSFNDNFGWDVAIDGDYVVVGAYGYNTFAGRVGVFKRDQGGADNWGHVKWLQHSSPLSYDYFGYSVDIDGDYAIVGIVYDDAPTTNQGSAMIFNKDYGGADNWGLAATITSNAGAQSNGVFGWDVAISGTTVLIGHPQKTFTYAYAGMAEIWTLSGAAPTGWTSAQNIYASDRGGYDRFGRSVDIDGNFLVVGSPYWDSGFTDSGAAYIFYSANGINGWTQQNTAYGSPGVLRQASPANYDNFGERVTISGNVAAVIAHSSDEVANNSGSVHLFQGSALPAPTTWTEYLIYEPELAVANNLWLGYQHGLAIDDDALLIGAFQEDTQIQDGGAAYFVCSLLPPDPVTSLSVSNETDSSADLSWTDSADEDSYNIYVDGIFEDNIAANSTSYGLTGLSSGTNYTVEVRVLSGSCSASAETSVATTGVPAAPVDLTATAHLNRIKLSWIDKGNEEEYRIYWNTSNSQPSEPNAVIEADSNEYIVTGLESETLYYFWVSGWNADYGEGAAATTSETTEFAMPTVYMTNKLVPENPDFEELGGWRQGATLGTEYAAASSDSEPGIVLVYKLNSSGEWEDFGEIETTTKTYSLAIIENFIFVGIPEENSVEGEVLVYKADADLETLTLVDTLVSTDNEGVDSNEDAFGFQLVTSGNSLLVHALQAKNTNDDPWGTIEFFEKDPGSDEWLRLSRIVDETGDFNFSSEDLVILFDSSTLLTSEAMGLGEFQSFVPDPDNAGEWIYSNTLEFYDLYNSVDLDGGYLVLGIPESGMPVRDEYGNEIDYMNEVGVIKIYKNNGYGYFLPEQNVIQEVPAEGRYLGFDADLRGDTLTGVFVIEDPFYEGALIGMLDVFERDPVSGLFESAYWLAPDPEMSLCWDGLLMGATTEACSEYYAEFTQLSGNSVFYPSATDEEAGPYVGASFFYEYRVG